MTVTDARNLYGVVHAETAAGDLPWLPADVTFVPYRQIAALTRPAPTDPARQLRPRLLGYAELLDQIAAQAPVLPVRFGTTLPSASAVVEQVLAPQHDDYTAALAAVAEHTQYTVRARYRGDAAVREVLAERPATAALHRRLRPGRAGAGHGADRSARIMLGERVARAVHAKRAADTDLLTRWLRDYPAAMSVTPARSVEGERIADLACLVPRSRAGEFEAAVAALGRHWRERVRLRLLGPMAPYDFAAGLVAGELPRARTSGAKS